MKKVETITITAEQAEKALKTLDVLSESIRMMAEKEARIAKIRKEVREISNPILQKGRLTTADLRGSLKKLNATIAEKEEPYRTEAATKTQALRDEAAAEREKLIGVKNALYQSVMPAKPAEQTQPAQGGQ